MHHPLFEIIKTTIVGFTGVCNAEIGLDISLDVPPIFVSGCSGQNWEQTYLHHFGFDDSSTVNTAEQ